MFPLQGPRLSLVFCCDSPPRLAHLGDAAFFVLLVLYSCSHQSEEIRRHQRAVDHESFPHLEKARSRCALRWSLSLVAASYFLAGCLVVLMEAAAAAAAGRLKIRQLQ